MELRDTVELMNSKDFVDRFKAEYYQLDIRIKKLEYTLNNWNNLKFQPKCPKQVLMDQLANMKKYRDSLDTRCIYEDIEIKTQNEE